jgi:hypothetical protein
MDRKSSKYFTMLSDLSYINRRCGKEALYMFCDPNIFLMDRNSDLRQGPISGPSLHTLLRGLPINFLPGSVFRNFPIIPPYSAKTLSISLGFFPD